MKYPLTCLLCAHVFWYTYGQQTIGERAFHSSHFTIEKLAEGVYAAISTTGGYAICNAGIVDLGDETLLFDAFMTPEAAEDLKRAAATLTDSPIRYVVNSHYHNDHVGGNQVFEDAVIISTAKTRDLIQKHFAEETAYYKEIAPARLEFFKAADTTGMTDHQRTENKMWIGYFGALVSSLDQLQMTLPDTIFDNELNIHGTKRHLLLKSYNGHTESDIVMYLPAEQVVFTGDLLFIQNQPWLGDGDTEDLKWTLDQIATMPIQIIVPGHGPVGTAKDIAPMVQYVDHIVAKAGEYSKNGTRPEEDSSLKAPAPYDNWFLTIFYKPNVINMYEKMYKK